MNAPKSPARDLIAFVHGLSSDSVPGGVTSRVAMCLLEALGCGLFGSTREWSRILADEMVADGSVGSSTVLGRSELLSAPAAAMCNGTAIHGFELDDLIAESIVHPAACVIPAAIALGEAVDASGARLVEAVIAGYEVMHRLGVALGVEPSQRGFHVTSLTAPVACAVAAGKMLGLSLEQMQSAVGLACSASSGIKSFAADHGGGMVKRLHLGRSAEAGVRMAQLASRGFLGPPYGIDGKFGLLEVYGGAGAAPARLNDRLGERWAMSDVWFKVYPICGWIQSVVQGLVALRGAKPLPAQEIKAIEVGVSRYALQNNGNPVPMDTMGAQYSIPYCAAVALTKDPRDPACFLEDAVTDPVTRALASKVSIVVDADVEAVYPAKFAARVKLTLESGTVSEKKVMECHGTPADPCSEREQVDKFMLLAAARLPAAAATDLARAARSVATLRSVRELTAALHDRGAFQAGRKTA